MIESSNQLEEKIDFAINDWKFQLGYICMFQEGIKGYYTNVCYGEILKAKTAELEIVFHRLGFPVCLLPHFNFNKYKKHTGKWCKELDMYVTRCLISLIENGTIWNYWVELGGL